jgi:hypothetical protein
MELEEVYITFRKVQGLYNGKPYRLPKDISKHIDEKMTKVNKDSMITLCHWFNTKWRNINLEKYFEAGFELYGNNFTYTKFFDKKIVRLYIQLDKNKKRFLEINKKGIIESFKYVKSLNYPSLESYCNKLNGNIHLVVEDYLKDKIDKVLLAFFINYKYIRSLTDEDRQKIPYIITNWREHLELVKELTTFIEKCIEKIYKKG